MEGKQKLSIRERVEKAFNIDDVMFHETEVQANRLCSLILFCSGVILLLVFVLTYVGVFPLSMDSVYKPVVQGLVEIAILLIICRAVHHDAWWLKFLLMMGIVFVYARLDSMLTHKAAILMVLPVVLSSRYFSRRLTIYTAVLSVFVFCCSAIWGATHGMINLNIVTMPAGTEMIATGGFLGDAVINAGVSDEMLIKNTLLYDFLPKWFMFSVAAIISVNIARRGREMVIAQHEKDLQATRIESELSLATRIQTNMLPTTFPPFPEKTCFDIFATMNPAKEVGGDFYDFFLIDEDHLCLLIADVSGKGIPGALFMMSTKIILANNAQPDKTPAEILEDTNETICANNKEEMFVTVWLGIVELSTGKLIAANAGHEYPAICHPGGSFELFSDKHGFVIGGMEGMHYQNYELMLEPGSKLFVYTDGVTEATNSSYEMFATNRTIAALNESPKAHPKQLIENVHNAVTAFVDNAEQFDDETMLCFEYKGMS